MAQKRPTTKPGSKPDEPDRKETIIYHARNLFQERSFDGVNIREIMQLAEVSQPTIYYYFQNKDGLFLAVLLDILAEIDDEFNRASRSNDFQEQLEIIALAFTQRPAPNLPTLFAELRRRVEHNKQFPDQGITSSQARSAFVYVNQLWPRSLENILREARRHGEASFDDLTFTANHLLTVFAAYPHSPFTAYRARNEERTIDTLLDYLKTMLKANNASAQI
jgi:AcrR family transcriptional regulator